MILDLHETFERSPVSVFYLHEEPQQQLPIFFAAIIQIEETLAEAPTDKSKDAPIESSKAVAIEKKTDLDDEDQPALKEEEGT